MAMTTVGAQELNCSVEINSDQVQGSNKSVFETLQSAINDYFNTTTFTNAKFSPNEKIECRFFLTIKEVNDNTFTGDIQVQSSRPVYNSSYTTTLINFKDSKVEFSYQEGEPLIFSENSMESQLTAILNFYAYLFWQLISIRSLLAEGNRFSTGSRRLCRWPSRQAKRGGASLRTLKTVRRC